jgi:MFS transporter, ACS family, hexuronate transporter
MTSSFSLRWVAVSVFILSSTLNYLDRQILSVLAPLIMTQMHFNQTGFGLLISTFSIAYAASSLFTGWMLDRFGVTRGICAAVTWWSLAALSTGLVRGLNSLAACRAALGIGESAGVPAVGKLNGIYLAPGERALGAAVNQIGLSVGAALAPLFIPLALTYGWRMPFVVAGLLGFVWIPCWLIISRAIPAKYGAQEFAPASRATRFSILRERNLLLLVTANVMWMGAYSLWSNWTTLYLTRVHHISLQQSEHYVWIPPLISNVGGFFGGWLSLRWMKGARDALSARRRAIWVSTGGSLVTLLLPLAPDATWATAIISLSFFFALAGSVNIYALPIDLYGPQRSGIAIAALTFAFGILQTIISPIIGFLADHKLYTEVVWLVTVPLVLAALVLMACKPDSELRDA